MCVCVDFTVDSYFQIRVGGVVACAELIVSINSNNLPLLHTDDAAGIINRPETE